MRILFLTRSFNGLAQRLYLELTVLGHEVAIEFDISDAVTLEAVALHRPALVIAPYLTRAIPEALWRHTVCLVVHPGITGDRGPSALDWAVLDGEHHWGVTVLQAEAEMDAGPVWSTVGFVMRDATKSSLYRQEVTEAATQAVLAAVRQFERTGPAPPCPLPVGGAQGRWRPRMTQAERSIDWALDNTATVLRKLRASDGSPGVLDEVFGLPCHLFDAHAVSPLPAVPACAPPGSWVGRRHEALLRSTCDGLVAIGHLRRIDQADSFKLPATLAFPVEAAGLPVWPASFTAGTDPDIRYEDAGEGVGALHFAFYNGALGTAQCQRLQSALQQVLVHPPRVLVLFGGTDFWCNGIHLNLIEAAASPADESWRNINAIDDLTQTLIEATGCLVVAAMQGSAGAGGVFLALAADLVWARPSVVLNPHYKNMGNLYGSEYWTYLLPRRPLTLAPAELMARRLPLSARQAQALGLLDDSFGDSPQAFTAQVLARARAMATRADLPERLQAKCRQRARDEAVKPLAAYRAEELAHMRRNFYGFDPSYHIARSNFVRRVAPSWTPRHLAVHRVGGGPGARAAVLDGDQSSGRA
ncbi:MAG: hydrogenase maturation protein [Rubrivivax sp.]|nr:hydrogenase maturation protein [Rubrivivax sp.]